MTRVLSGILFLILLHNPLETLNAVLPPSYSVALAWNPSPASGVTGYRIYYGTVSGNHSNSVVAGNVTTGTISGLASGSTYFFVVVAYNAIGIESAFSNEISFVPGLPVVRLRVPAHGQAVLTVKGLIGHTYQILATQTLSSWTVIGTVTLGASGSVDFTDPNAASFPKRFYRTRDTQP